MKRKKFYFILFLFIFLSSCDQHIDYIQSYYYNEKYKYLLNKKTYDKAQNAELIAKENLQDHFELDSNLGIVFNLLSKNDESEKSFNQALNSASLTKNIKPSDLFSIYFNRGVFFQSQNKVDEALINYQKALDVNPTSMETKTNIELLIQKQKEDQKQDQKNKQGQGSGKKDKKDQDKKDGDKNEKNKDNKNDKDKKDGENKDKPDDKNGDKDKDQNKGNGDHKQNTKYQPRPFKGDQLSEGDVKKILGELSHQDKKIRSQYDKKEKNEMRHEGKNEKDW